MPIATTLPQNNVTLRFPPRRLDREGNEEEESYQLLELPPEILKAVEKSDSVFPSAAPTACRLMELTL
jgi:sister chromatid cohesion protein DCC1